MSKNVQSHGVEIAWRLCCQDAPSLCCLDSRCQWDFKPRRHRLSTVKHRSLGPWGRWYADDFKNQVHPWSLLWLDRLSTKCFLEAKAGFQNETHRLRPCCRQRWCHCRNFAILSMWRHWRHWCHHNLIFLIYINLVQALGPLGNIRHVHSFRIAFGCIWFKWRNLPKSHQWLIWLALDGENLMNPCHCGIHPTAACAVAWGASSCRWTNMGRYGQLQNLRQWANLE